MPFRPLIWIPDVGTRTELSPLFHRKDPFLAPSNSGCYGLSGLNGVLPLWGDKAPQSSGEGCQGRQNVWGGKGRRCPRQNVSLKAAGIWWLTGGYTLQCGSPGRSGGVFCLWPWARIRVRIWIWAVMLVRKWTGWGWGGIGVTWSWMLIAMMKAEPCITCRGSHSGEMPRKSTLCWLM